MSSDRPIKEMQAGLVPSFFLMIRRPPRSTPFPTRRSSDLVGEAGDQRQVRGPQARQGRTELPGGSWGRDFDLENRSEEHTSELQSRSDVVCRLLLEKKKCDTGELRAIASSAIHTDDGRTTR